MTGVTPTSDAPGPAVPDWMNATETALVLTEADGRLLCANDAARGWLSAPQASTLHAALGLPDDTALPTPPAVATLPASGPNRPALRLSVRPLGEHLLWTLQPQVDVGEVERLQERLSLLTEFGRLGLWERNLQTLEGSWDDTMFRLFGLEPDSGVPGFASASARIVDLDRERLRRTFLGSLAQPGRHEAHYRVVTPHGLRHLHSQWRVIPASGGRPARALGMATDDTEVWRQAQDTDLLQAQVRLAVALTRLILWRMDLATNRIHYSDAGWAMLGREPVPEGMPSTIVREWLHPEDLPLMLSTHEVVMVSEQPVDCAVRARDAQGQWRHLLTRRVLQRDEHGQPLAILGVAFDQTPQHEAAETAERERAERLAAQRANEDKSRFMARMSHELRTPLNAVMGFGQLLDADPRLSDETRRRVRQILAAGQQLVGLVDQVLEVTQADDMATRAVTAQPAPAAPRHRVLYIEDNAVNAMIVSELIARRDDLQLEVCDCGQAGVRSAQACPPDLALIDMHLPDIDGLEVLARLRADPRTANVPCVALSANAMPDDIRHALASGFTDYWTKPLDFRQFNAGLEARFGPGPSA